MKAKLSKEKTEFLESFEKGEWVPVPDLSRRKKELVSHAQNTLRKGKAHDANQEDDCVPTCEPAK